METPLPFKKLPSNSFANFRAIKPIPANVPEWLAPRESREKEPKWYAVFSRAVDEVSFLGMTETFFEPRTIQLQHEWCVDISTATRQKPVVLLTVDNPNYEG